MPTFPLSPQPVPTPRIAWPYVIVAGVNDGSGTSSPALFQFKTGGSVVATANITIPPTSDSTNYLTPEQLATELQTLLTAALPGGYTVGVSVSSTGFFTFSFFVPNSITSVVIAWSNGAARQ